MNCNNSLTIISVRNVLFLFLFFLKKGKTKRITASNKTAASTNPISTSSWRVGQEIRKKVLEDMKKSNKRNESETEYSPEASGQSIQNEAMSGITLTQLVWCTYVVFIKKKLVKN